MYNQLEEYFKARIEIDDKTLSYIANSDLELG